MGLQKIIEELQEKLAIATGKSRTTSQASSIPPSHDRSGSRSTPKDQSTSSSSGKASYKCTVEMGVQSNVHVDETLRVFDGG
ncbi:MULTISPECIES: hypothetical protein [unclassified Microcoleus]|uniref:hypothetical protein n=1 Tax=unclassified Microcoleus TaxID=2642155 RepID=UPI002FCE8B22